MNEVPVPQQPVFPAVSALRELPGSQLQGKLVSSVFCNICAFPLPGLAWGSSPQFCEQQSKRALGRVGGLPSLFLCFQ